MQYRLDYYLQLYYIQETCYYLLITLEYSYYN
jgi:hypothetical protein